MARPYERDCWRGKRDSMQNSAKMLIALLLLALMICPAPAQSHGYIVRAIPADRSRLERPPSRLQYWFSEDLEPRFSEINLRDQAGAIIASGGVDPKNHALLSLRVPPGLGDGAYVVELRPAFASDGHVIAESRVFFVGEFSGDVSGITTEAQAIPLEALWRALLNLANFLLFGASLLYSHVLLPAWGSAVNSGARLPSRVMRRLRCCLVSALVLALVANLLALLQQSMAFFNADAAQILQQNLWQVTLIGSRFGDIWTLRLVLLIFCAVLLFAAEYFRDLLPQLAEGIWRGLPWLGALFIGLSMITSHAAGSTLLPWAAIAVDWLHALAVAFWLGGALTLTLVLPIALAPYEAGQRREALRAVLLRFSRIMLPLVGLVIASGFYNALNFISNPADLATNYGRSLGIKLLLGLPVFILGAWQHIGLRPQLAETLQLALARLPRIRGLLSPPGVAALRLEVLLMLAVLIAVAWLSATPVPEPDLPRSEIETPQATLSIDDLTITSAVMPGGPGVNTYDIVVGKAGQGVENLRVFAQLVNPERGIRSDWLFMEPVESGLYAAAGDEIDREGLWQLLVDIVDADGGTTRAAFAWDISQAAAIQQLRPVQPIHLVALMLLAAVLAVWFYPGARRLVISLNPRLPSLLIALAAIVVSLAVMAAGAMMISERQRNYELTLNPPPTVVNPTLPDADSLKRGEALYDEFCSLWQDHAEDFRALRNRLNTVGDDFLFEALSTGWRSLPACGGNLTVEARWDVVNYARTFEARDG